MAIVINGSGTVTGISVGGLPDGVVDTDTLANTTVTAAKVAADVATQAELDAAGFDTDAAQVFNESGADVDFRVESDTLTHALFLQGSDGNIGVGTNTPKSVMMLSRGSYGAQFGGNLGEFADSYINLENSTGNGDISQITFGFSGGSPYAAAVIAYENLDEGAQGKGDLIFATRAANTSSTQPITRLRITAAGSVSVVGALSKGSGSFLIDHPIASKKDTHNLVHSFVESPKADLIYRGVATLSSGTATVNIDTAAGMTDGTFVLLCDDVQCFTSNESNWDLIKGSVSGNILSITSQNDSSTAEISWMVIGDRKDDHMKDINTAWTDSNGKPIVEPLKFPEE